MISGTFQNSTRMGFRASFKGPNINISFERYLVRPVSTQTRLRAHKGCRSSHSSHSHFQQYAAVQESSNETFGRDIYLPIGIPGHFVKRVEMAPNLEAVTIAFQDSSFTFHAQWLHDAQVDDGPSKDDANVFSRKVPIAQTLRTSLTGTGAQSVVNMTWNDGSTSSFPAIWLRAMAPLVAKRSDLGAATRPDSPAGWLANMLVIPEVSYSDLFPQNAVPQVLNAAKERVLDAVLQDSTVGIVKVVGLPAPDFESERNKENTIVTKVLKQLFGSVFFHPVRGADKTFNVASHHEVDMKRGAGLPNYNPNQLLLPHADHAHYTHPARVQGLYALEGVSENTFVSCFAALETLKKEAPHLYEPFCKAPMATGRVAHFYTPSMYQATTDTAVTMYPGFSGQVKRFRWHPHLTGSLLSRYDDFAEARLAHRTFQEIMCRDSHLFRFVFKPGDLYIWDNFRVLHGRERVTGLPRTAVGQTVPEQVVADRYRVLKMSKLKDFIDERWLVHTPLQQLHEMVRLVGLDEPEY
jgi:trimethyllysine dioxygenase